MAQIDDLAAYYQNLLIAQYHDRPRAMDTIYDVSRETLSDLVWQAIRDGFDVETAVGAQLDLIGAYAGVTREISTTVTNRPDPAFGYSNANVVAFGVDGYGAGNFQRTYPVNTSLGDTNYRFLIKMKIIQNSGDHSLKSIDDYLELYYGDQVNVTDNKNMVLTYHFPVFMRTIMDIAVQKELLPAPAGVDILLVSNNNPNGDFGFSVAGTADADVNGYGFAAYVGGSYSVIYAGQT